VLGRTLARRSLAALSSLRLTLACLAGLMVLVAACTLAQVDLGTFRAVDKYFRCAFLYWSPAGAAWRVPVFPAGGAIGALLLANLVCAHATRFTWTRRKAGIWLTHVGLILLVLGEFVTGLCALESQLPLEEGESRNWAESLSEAELAVTDVSPAAYDEVVAIPEALLARRRELGHPRLPFSLRVAGYYPNASLSRRPEGAPASLADRGVGPGLVVAPLARTSKDDERDQPAAYVELKEGGRSLGTWLVSLALGAPQSVEAGGRRFLLALRPRRRYLPFTLTLKDFRHDVYAGTEIPKNFSSLLRLTDLEKGEDRDVLVYMNAPLRYRGATFYQASFGKGDTLSILQVVHNPGWRLPYLSCALVALGLLTQFLLHLSSFGAARSREVRA
jgi:hypothetical protein